jgi:hypothetical protein
MAKQITDYSVGEAFDEGKEDEMLSWLMWKLHERQRAKVRGMTVGELVKSSWCDQGLNVLKRIAIEEQNEHYTPFQAFEEIAEYIPKDKTIWECFTRGNHAHIKAPQFLRQLGFTVIATGQDFFSHNYGDIVVSNPPFSHGKGEDNMKQKVIERLIKLNKPFMLLMPTSFLQTKIMRRLMKSYGNFQFIIPTSKVNFYHLEKNGKLKKSSGTPTFYTMWYCWNMKFEKDFHLI